MSSQYLCVGVFQSVESKLFSSIVFLLKEILDKKSFNFSSSDLSLCAKLNGINCTENYNWEDCEQLTDTNFKNYGCKFFVEATDYFECSNRNDKKDVLFESLPIYVKKISKKGINYNTELLFDNDYIYCGKHNFTYKDFYQVKQDHGMEDCDLADEGQVPIGDLWSDLLIDFSFNMTKKMNDL